MSFINLATVLLRHPLDAFEIIKRNRDTTSRRLVIPLLYALFLLIRFVAIYTEHYAVTGRTANDANLALEIAFAFAPLITWNVASYAFTSIIGGETKMSQIFVASAYALAPYILITPFQILLSRVMSSGESVLYKVISFAVTAWIVLLLFLAYMYMNQYSISKAAGTAVIAIGIMLILWAVLLLVGALTFQVYFSIKEMLQEMTILRL